MLLVAAGCSRAFDPDVRTGSHLQLADGHPEMLYSAIAFIDDANQPVIDLDIDVVYGSLIYRERDGVFTAGVEIQTEIYRMIDESDDEFERVEMFRESIDVKETTSNITDSRDTFSYHERIPVKPGRYRVLVQLTDRDSGKSIRRRTNVTVYDPESEMPSLTHIKVHGYDQKDRDLFPLTTYSIPGRVDTIRFEYQVTRPEGSDPLAVRMRLVKFESDTLPARPMYVGSPSTDRGINYRVRDEIESQERILEQETGTITIEYETKRPPRGNYRFEVEIASTGDNSDNTQFRARDFSSMSSNFPYVINTREFAHPLVYLMRRNDHRDMMKIENRDDLKREIDRFWLSNLRDKDQASRVIEKYYQRVEQANKQFSNFKEGWMTDMGMVYILFGPPWYVDQSLSTVVWIYGYNQADPERVFYFRRTRVDSDVHPFEHYTLRRGRQYHNVEYDQVQRWLSGAILTRPI